MDNTAIAQHNRGVRYVLVVIDVFSRFCWTVPVKNKTGESLVKAFHEIFKSTERRCGSIITDSGGEFKNKKLINYLKSMDISYFNTFNPQTKCSIVERLIRTLRLWLQRIFTHTRSYNYIDGALSDVTYSYNNKIHRTLKMTPKRNYNQSKRKESLVLCTIEV
jgi:transposase InsO family protein